MREFIDDNGFYKINIPEGWAYTLKDSKVHTFDDVDGVGTLQISFNEKTNQGENNIKKLIKKLSPTKFGNLFLFKLPGPRDDEFIIEVWLGEIDKYLITVSFTYDKKLKDKEKLNSELALLPNIISTIKLIPESERKEKLVWYRLGQFLKGVAATSDLLNNAVGHNSFIEAVVILANQIDAQLRIGLILKQQLIQNNSAIDLKFLYQGNTDKIITEKEVYRQAMGLKIIDNEIYKALIDLYGERNKVVHRYIISDITTIQIDTVARRYYRLSEEVKNAIVRLEDEQIQKGIGMTVGERPKTGEKFDDNINSWLLEKHGGIKFNNDDQESNINE